MTLRTATRRRYLMCPPTYFEVSYAINAWMDAGTPVDSALVMEQWENLRRTYESLGHEVNVIEPVPGLPDMVFAANCGLVVDGKVLGASFRYDERKPEAPAYHAWLTANGYSDLTVSQAISEGEGDFTVAGELILAGTGFRTDREAHEEARQLFGRRVVTLELVDPRYYHLDVALAVLDDETIMYYPGAFSEESQRTLKELFPNAVIATEDDADAMGLNGVSDGANVVLPVEAKALGDTLSEHGFTPVYVDLSELRKGGGSVKCCTLELRD
jgi:N-dimethylarginine dimethylaminohydrolase